MQDTPMANMAAPADKLAPQQQDFRKWLRTATPKSLGEWVAALPRSNLSAMAQNMGQALKTLDDLDIQPMQKFTLLDVLRAGSYQTVEGMTSGFMGSASGFSEEFKNIINQAMLLQGQLASSYTNVAISARLLGQSQLFIMGSALHRAMMDQYSMVAFYLQLNLSVPQQLWRQLHRLFKVAEEGQLLAHVMGDNVFANEQMLTIKQIYMAALLLGAARCNQLHAEEVTVIAKALKKWALQVEIARQPEQVQDWQLALDLDSGACAHFETAETLRGSGNWRYLHTRKLVAHLARQTGQTVKLGERAVPLHEELLKHLAAAWSEYIERDNTRHERDDSVMSSVGFEALHYYLTGAMDVEQFIGELRPEQSAQPRKLVMGDVPESFNFHAYLPADINNPEVLRHPCHEVRVVNESTGGYCLEWPLEAQEHLLVGEILGIKESYAPYWKVGEVVWLKKTEDNRVRAGIRVLSQEAIPVVARVPQTMGQRGDKLPSLLLPRDRELGADKTTFLVPNVNLKMGEQLKVVQEGNEQAIQLLEPVKETPAYSQFECAYLVIQQ